MSTVLGRCGRVLGLSAYLVFSLFPIYWIVKIAVTPSRRLFSEGITFLPPALTLANFDYVLRYSPFPRFFLNSVLVSVATAVLTVIIAGAIGYAFSRFRFRGRSTVMVILLVTQLFPLVMLVTPIYRLFAPLGLINSLVGLAIVYTAFSIPFTAFLTHSFFDGIPREFEEAAMIDGCTRPQALVRVIIPLVLSGTRAAAALVFTHAWSELLFALMLLHSEANLTFAVGLTSFVTESGVDWGAMTAAATFALIPVCVFFAFAQRYLVHHTTLGALAG